MAVSILLVEDLDIVREGLRALLNGIEQYSVVGEAANGIEAVNYVASLKPDVVLMDMHMPGMNGFVAGQEIKKEYPETKVIALTADTKDDTLFRALRAKVDGYILKNASTEDLVQAINTVLRGKTYISPDISPQLIKGFLKSGLKEGGTPLDVLTRRELQVLQCIAKGATNKTVAEMLTISTKTVEKHKANLKHKIGAANTADLITFAKDQGLTE